MRIRGRQRSPWTKQPRAITVADADAAAKQATTVTYAPPQRQDGNRTALHGQLVTGARWSRASSSGSLCKWIPPKQQKQRAQIIYIMKWRKGKNAKRQWRANKRRAASGMCCTCEPYEWLWAAMNAFHIALEQEIVRAHINDDWQKAEADLLLFLCRTCVIMPKSAKEAKDVAANEAQTSTHTHTLKCMCIGICAPK